MSPKGLRISDRLTLPTDFATKSLAILAQRRKGKTYTASVLAEECVACKIPFVALDPTGVWWGLRASADGQKEGLPVYVFGGQHASDPHMKLERTAGKEVARFVVDFPGYYVIDFKSFGSREAERQFATDFGEELYRYKQRPKNDFVQHLFVDEADLFVPQDRKGVERMLGSYEAIVRRGGVLGLGTSLISQRAAIVNKNVLEQIDTLIVLRTVGPNDREAIRKYVVANGTEEEVRALMDSVASLELGEAWVYEPGGDPPLFDRVRIRERRTYNSSATPKAGEKRIEPKRLADVELAALRERMAQSIEKGKAEDPKELRKRLREAEAELARTRKSLEQRPTAIEKPVEVPAVPDDLPPRLLALADRVNNLLSEVNTIEGEAQRIYQDLADLQKVKDWANARGAGTGTPRAASRGRTGPSSERTTAAVGASSPRPAKPAHRSGDVGEVSGPQQKVLDALAWLESVGQSPARRTAVGLIAGYSATSGGFNNLLGSLRSAGYIDYPQTGTVALTDAGRAIATAVDIVDEEELREMVYKRVGAPKTKILRVLVECYPDALSREQLGELTGYSATSGGFNNLLGSLRTVGLLDYPTKGYVVATDALFLENP